MGYKIIYLDGTNGLLSVECEVCKETNRNVVEPVAVFVPEDKEEEYRQKLKSLKSDSNKELDKFIEELYEGVRGKIEEPKTCIFHCDKENDIWIENLEEYLSDKENSKIIWRNFLVEEFWKRIRAYRFAVDYTDLWNKVNENWDRFLKELEKIEYAPDEEELNKYKNLVLFNFKQLKEIKEKKYDLNKFIFPKFEKYNCTLHWIEGNETYVHIFTTDKSFNFWFENELLEFKYRIDFPHAKFKDDTEFKKLKFNSYTNFYNAEFYGKTSFFEVEFKKETVFDYSKFLRDVSFSEVNIYGNAAFTGAYFNKHTDFTKVNFYRKVDFRKVNFRENVNFFLINFHKEVSFRKTNFLDSIKFLIVNFKGFADFWKVDFYKSAKFLNVRFHSIVRFDWTFKLEHFCPEFGLFYVWVEKDSYIEIINLKTEKLILDNINNTTENFIFWDCTIEETLEIRNSLLNKMKFVNLDLSKAQNIYIEGSDVAEVKFVNTNWGEISERRICKELFEKNPGKAREVYRQLKLALDNQKDYINANRFYSLEMKAYEKVLGNKSCIKAFQDKLVFKIHKSASDFGQSWIRPLVWIILISISFALIKYLHKEEIPYRYLPDWAGSILNSIAKLLNEFAKAFLIIPGKDKIQGIEFISLIIYILLAFFTYQFIVAVRRKVRR